MNTATDGQTVDFETFVYYLFIEPFILCYTAHTSSPSLYSSTLLRNVVRITFVSFASTPNVEQKKKLPPRPSQQLPLSSPQLLANRLRKQPQLQQLPLPLSLLLLPRNQHQYLQRHQLQQRQQKQVHHRHLVTICFTLLFDDGVERRLHLLRFQPAPMSKNTV